MNKKEIKQAYLDSADKNDRFILRRYVSMKNPKMEDKTSKCESYYKISLNKDLDIDLGYLFMVNSEVHKSNSECTSVDEISKILEAKAQLKAYRVYLKFVKLIHPELQDKYLAEFYLIKANSIIWVKKMIRKQKRYICKLKKKS